jgi:predicted metal-dependent phosphoesterase TrpH
MGYQMTNQRERGRSRIDLHLHSTASDGTTPPSGVVELAAAHGLRSIALTDHDSTSGIAEAREAGSRIGVEVIAGIELSTAVKRGELHMLGYLIDPENEILRERLQRFRDSRERRAETMVDRLREAGIPITLERVLDLAAGGSIGRPHVARALVEAGQATSVSDAFERYLVRGKVGYVPHLRPSPADAIEFIHAAHGVAVLAHPYSTRDVETTVSELAGAGLDGLEVFYSLYNDEQRAFLARLADQHDLVPTGGSDFHGTGEREGHEIGSANVPDETIDRLRRVVAARRCS